MGGGGLARDNTVVAIMVELSVVKAWVSLYYMYVFINTSLWFIHTSVFIE